MMSKIHKACTLFSCCGVRQYTKCLEMKEEKESATTGSIGGIYSPCPIHFLELMQESYKLIM